VQPGREAVLEREQRWRVPVAVATFGAIALVIVSMIVVGGINGDGEAEVLRTIDQHRSDVTLSGILRSLGLALLVFPLVYLFRAAQARSDRVRGQLIGLIVVAPLFLAGGSLLNSIATNQAAEDFVAGKVSADMTANEAASECRDDRRDDAEQFREDFGSGTAALDDCASEKLNDDAATNAVTDASSRGIATGLGFGGSLGLAFGLAYSCLWAMRVGLLTRFWGSLGIALGVAALLQLTQFTMLWFLYFGFLLLGWVPGGRPPAWAAGEAVPWPTPGEKIAGTDQPDETEPEQ
jgi:hypothetical protein